MTAEEIAAIKKRLEQSISTLETQTQVLKNDLKALNTFLEKKEDVDPVISKKINEHEEATRKQLAANQALLNEIDEIDTKSAAPQMISELEKRTVAMLNRMQQKVSAKEIISDLYEEITEAPPNPETVEVPLETTDSIEEEAKKIKNEQEMESTVKKLKDAEALNDLKKKLGMG